MSKGAKWTHLAVSATSPFAGTKSIRELGSSELRVVFQPLVNLSDGSEIGREVFVRCAVPELASPQMLWAKAMFEKACGHLGRAIRDVAFARCPDVPLFTNIHLEELSARWLVRPDDPMGFHEHPVFLEVNEHVATTNSELCNSVLTEVRERCGARLVIDDFGVRYNDVEPFLPLQPSMIKLDPALIRNLQRETFHQEVVARAVARCKAEDILVLAECVETVSELDMVRQLGVAYAQGHLLGVPADPAPPIRWPYAPSPKDQRPESLAPDGGGVRSGRTKIGVAPAPETDRPGRPTTQSPGNPAKGDTLVGRPDPYVRTERPRKP